MLESLRAEVLEANLELFRRGLVIFTFGNASAYVGTLFPVTTSEAGPSSLSSLTGISANPLPLPYRRLSVKYMGVDRDDLTSSQAFTRSACVSHVTM